MKRSEMLNKMIVHMSRKDWEEPDMDYKEYMDKLLTMIEKEGMEPPIYEVLMRDGTKFVRGKNEGDVRQMKGWEDED